MVKNNSQPFADLWPASACLLRAATAISRPSEHYNCTSDMAQKAVPVKADLTTFGSVSVVVGWLIDKAINWQ